MLSGDRVLGVIAIERLPADAFNEIDERLLATIAANRAWRSKRSAVRRDETSVPRPSSATPNWRSSTRSARPSPNNSTSRQSSTQWARASDPSLPPNCDPRPRCREQQVHDSVHDRPGRAHVPTGPATEAAWPRVRSRVPAPGHQRGIRSPGRIITATTMPDRGWAYRSLRASECWA